MARFRGLRLGSARLRQPLTAVAVDQPSGGRTRRDLRQVRAAGRPATGPPPGEYLQGTPRSVTAARDALPPAAGQRPKTGDAEASYTSSSRVMSSRLKRRRTTSTDDTGTALTPAVQKVSQFAKQLRFLPTHFNGMWPGEIMFTLW